MALVTSLDKDMRQLRMDRYTPQAAREVRSFIEDSLGERLQEGDLLESLKDGVALCKLVNLAAPNALRFKTRATMPFVKMENISLFLQACQSPPFNLQAHDVFLTVDLFESKDPAQVLQCLGSFSRAAHRIAPSKFPEPVGGKSRGGVMSPQRTGGRVGGGGGHGATRGRGNSDASNRSSDYNSIAKAPPALTPRKTGDSNSGRWSPTKKGTPISPNSVSSWSKKADEGATSPAWNIAQYGYMGGASQGNLGVSFGGRRQITTAGPTVPSMAERVKMRKAKDAEEERVRQEADEAKRRELEEIRAERERAQLAEEAEAAKKQSALEADLQRIADERRRWDEEHERWRIEEERMNSTPEIEYEQRSRANSNEARRRLRVMSEEEKHGGMVSWYHSSTLKPTDGNSEEERERIKDLERQLSEARERERIYELERKSRAIHQSHEAQESHDFSVRMKEEALKARNRSRSRPRVPPRITSDERPREEPSESRNRSRSRPRIPPRTTSDEGWRKDEREYLRKQWKASNASEDQNPALSKSPRPLPEPTAAPRLLKNNTGSRPLPDPAKYATASKPAISKPIVPTPSSGNQTRVASYLSANAPPVVVRPRTTYSNEIGGFDSTAERDAEDCRREDSQTKTKAGGWASKSLLEREMEMERQRQQEWEEGQKELKTKTPSGAGVEGVGGGIGGKWDVNQWTGYTGGDGQNRGSQGIGSGRRQIVGPRPPPGGR
ncbi:hypothetical protein BJ875DRAFT_496054 [Amylocarpus encephaloides]|uniref:Calponin-homology (CH) domain-containing protein n=1 Tax=Amylocarpus encephaloides TaxID=45428 RepID=A0A9P7YHZ7_9HELO|nr:hypothetical protein BJ875DRAFT_496054 [Amylocarpus encephaloides]